MIDELSYEELAAQVNTKFRLTDAAEPFEIELIEATKPVITPRQEIFSLIFLGSQNFSLPQGTYELSHEKLGDGRLFLVPVGQSAAGISYEAAFNRLRDD